jgi:hypothetical protein
MFILTNMFTHNIANNNKAYFMYDTLYIFIYIECIHTVYSIFYCVHDTNNNKIIIV